VIGLEYLRRAAVQAQDAAPGLRQAHGLFAPVIGIQHHGSRGIVIDPKGHPCGKAGRKRPRHILGAPGVGGHHQVDAVLQGLAGNIGNRFRYPTLIHESVGFIHDQEGARQRLGNHLVVFFDLLHRQPARSGHTLEQLAAAGHLLLNSFQQLGKISL